MLVNESTNVVVPRLIFIIERNRCCEHIAENLTLGAVARYCAKLCGRKSYREACAVIIGNSTNLVLSTCHKLLLILVVEKIIAPVVNESHSEQYVTELTLLIAVYLIDIKCTEELLHAVDSLHTVKLMTVNKIAESLYLNNLKVVAVVVMSTRSTEIVGLCSAELTHVDTAVSLTVYNGVCGRTVAIKCSGLIYVHIKERKETLVGGVNLFKRLSDSGNIIPGYEKTGMLLGNLGKILIEAPA